MPKYRNIFKEMTEVQLVELYKQYLDFKRNGVVADGTELIKIKAQYIEWFTENPMEMLTIDLLDAVSDFWFKNKKTYSDSKKYRYKIEYCCSEGVCEGTIVLTEAEAHIVDYAMNTDHWDDFYADMYSADGGIDINNPIDLTSPCNK